MAKMCVVNGYITGYALVGDLPNSVEIPDERIKEIDLHKLGYLKFIDGEIIFDSEKYKKEQKTKAINQIRRQRKLECFNVINRGKPWYNKLTEQQISELDKWYEAWLEAPQTLEIPEKPIWIKQKELCFY